MKLDKTLQDRLVAIRIGDQVSYRTETGGETSGLCVGWSDVVKRSGTVTWSELAREKYVIVNDVTRVPLERVCSRRRETGVDRGVITWN